MGRRTRVKVVRIPEGTASSSAHPRVGREPAVVLLL